MKSNHFINIFVTSLIDNVKYLESFLKFEFLRMEKIIPIMPKMK